MNKKDITWGSIIPLIGGEAIGVMNYLDGKLPDLVLSYPAFAKNDSHFYNYLSTNRNWQDKPIMIDAVSNQVAEEDKSKLKYVDIMCSVPPCAGLSSLNNKSGSGCPANDWMYISTEFVLKNIKPKVLFGENAPRLATRLGKPVRDQLFLIAQKYNYSVAFFKTSSVKHGLCQKRPRTFFFLFKSEYAPQLNYYDRELIPFIEQIGKSLDINDPMNCTTGTSACFPNWKGIPTDDPYYRYILEEICHKTHPEFIASLTTDIPIIDFINKCDGGFSKFITWCKSKGFDSAVKKATAAQMKLDDHKGYWGHGLVAVPADGIAPSYVSRAPYGLIHPFEDRYLTLREGLRLMGLPDDFIVLGGAKNTNHVCQNVPVHTAEDMTEQAVNFILGNLELSTSKRLMVDNFKQKSFCEDETPTDLLTQFIQ